MMRRVPKMRTVAEVMSRDLLVLRDDLRVEVAARLLADHGYAGAPILDACGALTGVLHAVDVAVVHLPAQALDVRPVLVRHLSRPAVTVPPACLVDVAARRMRAHGTDRLIVVEPDYTMTGVVTGTDLLVAVADSGNLLRRTVDEQLAALGLPSVTAEVGQPGVVQLFGSVASWTERERVVRQIGRIDGVTEIQELISIQPHTTLER